MIGVLGFTGIRAFMTVEGGTSGTVFLRFVRQHLVPALRPGDVVVMDNLGAHHATGVRAEIEAVGASVMYMPPYSPDLNPIELCWSKIKQRLKGAGARSFRQLVACLDLIRPAITPKDSLGWYSHCGWLHQPE
jgi:transposase